MRVLVLGAAGTSVTFHLAGQGALSSLSNARPSRTPRPASWAGPVPDHDEGRGLTHPRC